MAGIDSTTRTKRDGFVIAGHHGLPPLIGVSGNYNNNTVEAIVAQIRAAGGVAVYLGDRTYELEKQFPPDPKTGRLSPENAATMRALAKRMAEEDVKQLDGLVIAGSTPDIDPRQYGEQPDPELYGNDPVYGIATTAASSGGNPYPNVKHYLMSQARQAYEIALAQRAMDANDPIPLLGICSGMNFLNLSGNEEGKPPVGTLVQDIEKAMRQAGHTPKIHYNVAEGFARGFASREFPFTPIQLIGFKPGSRLAALASGVKAIFSPSLTKDLAPDLPDGVVAENSFHHQGIAKVRPGFIATAFNEDGIIEAIEPDPSGPYAGKFFVGVQWHPEFAASDLSARIFKDLVAEAQKVDRAPGNSVLQYKERILPKSLTEQIQRRNQTVSAIGRYTQGSSGEAPAFSR